jgi:hypothetical protein
LKLTKNFTARMAALNVNPMEINEAALAILLELDRKHGTTQGMAILYDAAIVAMQNAASTSEDPADWITAARRAAQL